VRGGITNETDGLAGNDPVGVPVPRRRAPTDAIRRRHPEGAAPGSRRRGDLGCV